MEMEDGGMADASQLAQKATVGTEGAGATVGKLEEWIATKKQLVQKEKKERQGEILEQLIQKLLVQKAKKEVRKAKKAKKEREEGNVLTKLRKLRGHQLELALEQVGRELEDACAMQSSVLTKFRKLRHQVGNIGLWVEKVGVELQDACAELESTMVDYDSTDESD